MKNEENKTKPGYTKEEKFVCEITWGGRPIDSVWAKETGIFKANMNKFLNGDYKDLYPEVKQVYEK